MLTYYFNQVQKTKGENLNNQQKKFKNNSKQYRQNTTFHKTPQKIANFTEKQQILKRLVADKIIRTSLLLYVINRLIKKWMKVQSQFRKSFFNQIPSIIPLGLTGLSLAAGLATYLRESTPEQMPIQFTTTALFLSFAGVCFSFYILCWILKQATGNDKMNEVSMTILEGSQGFFRQQYGTISKYALVFAISIACLYGLRQNPLNLPYHHGDVPVSGFRFALLIGFSFAFGAICSGLSGFAGMWVSVRTNIRVAQASRSSYNLALQLAFSGGYFGAAINIALAVFGVSVLFIIFYLYLDSCGVSVLNHLEMIPLLMVGFGFGASFVAMFAQLGGGIYTKAADVGADLVGKSQQGFPEDDQRNPAVIADLVGDNVGDCAGQAADLFESITAQIISAMILGATLSKTAHLTTSNTICFMFFPLALHCLDLISSTIGLYFVKTTDYSDQSKLEDALDVMKRGYTIALSFGIVGFFGICYLFLRTSIFPNSWIYFSLCGLVGAVISYLFVIVTQYYTDYNFAPVKKMAKASQTGHATNIIAGLAVGMESTGFPVLIISFGVLISFHLGRATGITDLQGNLIGGLFGTAIATMGMFCTGVYVLSMSGFGPIADNAGGIVQMSQLPESVRVITDRLDAVGNVTKANAKGYSVGSAAMACFLLFSAFIDQVNMISPVKLHSVDITIPQVFVGGMLGGVVVFIFAGWAIQAVGNAAQDVIVQARSQMTADVINRKVKPDYTKCVAIVTAAGQRQMIKPGLLAVLSPIVVSLVFKYIGIATDQELLGAKAVCSFLMFTTATGILMALFLNNGGGAWDNTKKYCESQGLKKTHVHLAAVTGDTVGDPCKDTAGPSLHILIKLVSTITLVMVPILV